uniref:Response regulator n=1 Tax=Schlesneria paludicola TaxID=360056 RepID=A0A7C4QX84_9PLAN
MPGVLIVDDSAVDRRLAAGLIERQEGWTAATVEDGVEALASVLQHPVEIVLTDMQIPAMNGLELVKALRRECPQVAVVLMTAQGSEELAVQALQAGAASYVPKRALAAELVPTLRRVLAAASDERSQQSLVHRLQERCETYHVESDLALLMPLSRYLQQVVGDAWSLDKTERLRIGTAVEEALLNALYHGNLELDSQLKDEDYSRFQALAEERSRQLPYRDRRISVSLRLTPSTASITIRDDGPGFDPQSLPDPTDTDNLDRLCGRGVMLMRAFMSEVHYNATGNEVTLVKHHFEG